MHMYIYACLGYVCMDKDILQTPIPIILAPTLVRGVQAPVEGWYCNVRRFWAAGR